ncbi:glycoside hydrolase family 18 protein [Infundibulicybe gibba]|nr:glycoside hydrolase family 18 protein [Infundibulicybe gibba]
MFFICSVVIDAHTTSSNPKPHILYVLLVKKEDGTQYKILRRYSEFYALHASMKSPYKFPPKRTFSSTLPSAWVDDQLIEERKTALAAYINSVLWDSDLRANPTLLQFLSDGANVISMTSKEGIPSLVTVPDISSPIAASYYPTWCAQSNPPSKLNFSKFDIIFFAFAVPTSACTLRWDTGSQDTLKELVLGARKSGKGTKIVLSVGGWGGSYWWSHAVSTTANRSKMVGSLLDAVKSFGLDGIDIDWEYPNSPGAGNPHSSSDAANFLSLLKLLRTSLGPSKIISAAVTHLPWLGSDGNPLIDVSEYAAQMNYINIMNYDVFGASSKPGPNAPLGNSCGSSQLPQATAQAALTQWVKAGMPAFKLLLGLPLYGYVSKSTAKKLSGSLQPEYPARSGAHSASVVDNNVCSAGDLSNMWGKQIAFSQLLSSGALQKQSDGTYTAANGYTMGWDDCSDTPFLFNVGKTTVVSYDDTWSLADKATFAKTSGMAGCFTWSLDQDDGLTLHNVIRTSLGKK